MGGAMETSTDRSTEALTVPGEAGSQTPPPAHAPAKTEGAMPEDVTATLAHDRERSVAVRAWRRLRQEPSLMFTAAYVVASCIGLWANYWFYRRFDLPILEYMHASDYLVAGLRDPAYALVMLVALLIVFAVSWPDTWRRSHPERVARMQAHWWGRLVFPRSKWLRWRGLGLTPETGVVLAAVWGTAWATVWYVQHKAEYIQQGSGQPVQVTMAGETAPRAGEARLLGTGGAFVFIWWMDARRSEAIPVESIGRLRFDPQDRNVEVGMTRVPAPPTAKGGEDSTPTGPRRAMPSRVPLAPDGKSRHHTDAAIATQADRADSNR